MKGISSGAGWNFVKENIVEGSLPAYETDDEKNKVVISRIIADKLGLSVDDKVNAYFFTNNLLKARRIEVSAIYDTNFGDYDKMFIFCPLALAQGIAGIDGSEGTQIELMTNGLMPVDDSAMRLQDAMMQACYTGELKGTYQLATVTDNGMMYFNWLELLDTNVVVILVLMALVSVHIDFKFVHNYS